MAGIDNGHKTDPLEIDESVARIIVIGEESCGKSTFIRAFYQHAIQRKIDSDHGIRYHRMHFEINEDDRELAIFEIPARPDTPFEVKLRQYMSARIIIYLFAIDDPSSLEAITNRWIPELGAIVSAYMPCVAMVGNKLDLRNNEEVIARLANQNREPVTREQTLQFVFPDEYDDPIKLEVSSLDAHAVLDVFLDIFERAFGVHNQQA